MNNVSVETQLADAADAYINSPNHLTKLAAAFNRATDIPPEECACVHVDLDGNESAYYFARIVGFDDEGNLQLETVKHRGWLRQQLRRLLEVVW